MNIDKDEERTTLKIFSSQVHTVIMDTYKDEERIHKKI